MKPVMVPDWAWVRMDDPRVRWVQVFARLKPGPDRRVGRRGRCRDSSCRFAQHEMTLTGAKDWSAVHPRAVHEGPPPGRTRRRRLLGAAQRLLDGARRVDVHGRASSCSSPAPTWRTCSSHAGSCGSGRSRCACRSARHAAQLVRQLLVESLVLSTCGRRAGARARRRADALAALARAIGGSPLLVQAAPDARILLFTLGLTMRHGRRVRVAARSARQPARPVDDAQGHRRRRWPAARDRCSSARVSSRRRSPSASCSSSAPGSSCRACRT